MKYHLAIQSNNLGQSTLKPNSLQTSVDRMQQTDTHCAEQSIKMIAKNPTKSTQQNTPSPLKTRSSRHDQLVGRHIEISHPLLISTSLNPSKDAQLGLSNHQSRPHQQHQQSSIKMFVRKTYSKKSYEKEAVPRYHSKVMEPHLINHTSEKPATILRRLILGDNKKHKQKTADKLAPGLLNRSKLMRTEKSLASQSEQSHQISNQTETSQQCLKQIRSKSSCVTCDHFQTSKQVFLPSFIVNSRFQSNIQSNLTQNQPGGAKSANLMDIVIELSQQATQSKRNYVGAHVLSQKCSRRSKTIIVKYTAPNRQVTQQVASQAEQPSWQSQHSLYQQRLNRLSINGSHYADLSKDHLNEGDSKSPLNRIKPPQRKNKFRLLQPTRANFEPIYNKVQQIEPPNGAVQLLKGSLHRQIQNKTNNDSHHIQSHTFDGNKSHNNNGNNNHLNEATDTLKAVENSYLECLLKGYLPERPQMAPNFEENRKCETRNGPLKRKIIKDINYSSLQSEHQKQSNQFISFHCGYLANGGQAAEAAGSIGNVSGWNNTARSSSSKEFY